MCMLELVWLAGQGASTLQSLSVERRSPSDASPAPGGAIQSMASPSVRRAVPTRCKAVLYPARYTRSLHRSLENPCARLQGTAARRGCRGRREDCYSSPGEARQVAGPACHWPHAHPAWPAASLPDSLPASPPFLLSPSFQHPPSFPHPTLPLPFKCLSSLYSIVRDTRNTLGSEADRQGCRPGSGLACRR